MSADRFLSLWNGLLMLLVAALAAAGWSRASGAKARWFWVGAALWMIAVPLKLVCDQTVGRSVAGVLASSAPEHPVFYVAGAAFYTGIQSSLFEMGLTLLAGLIWRQLGKDATRAIAVGVGAGAFETAFLGALAMANVSYTTLYERVITLPVHASSRALILLGITARTPFLIVCGFLIFTLFDAVFGVEQALHASVWWAQLAYLSIALIGVLVLRWCAKRFPSRAETN
jgi:hypothetical protein